MNKRILKIFSAASIAMALLFPIGATLYASGDARLDAPRKLSDVFLDVNLASCIAEDMGINPNDVVTQAQLDDVVMISASFKEIENIEGIQYLNHVEFIDLKNNNISDLTPFSKNTFPNLSTIFLDANQIVDITPLATPTALTQLFLNENHIKDISSVVGFQSNTNNTSGSYLYNVRIAFQQVEYDRKSNNNLSIPLSGFSKDDSGTLGAYDFSDLGGEFNEATSALDYTDLDLSIKSIDFYINATYGRNGGTWTYSANATVNLGPAIAIIQVLDVHGKTLLEPVTLQGVVGEAYESTAVHVDGYTLTALPHNQNGYFHEEDQYVTYIFQEDAPIVDPTIPPAIDPDLPQSVNPALPEDNTTNKNVTQLDQVNIINTADTNNRIEYLVLAATSILILAWIAYQSTQKDTRNKQLKKQT